MAELRGAAVRHFTDIDSTNLEAGRLAEAGEAGPLWLLANKQMAGRGRLGRKWQSPRGNVYSTLLLPLETELRHLPQLGFVVALAVYDVVARIALPEKVKLKWPNDCLIDGAKCAGILCEVVKQKPLLVAVGCGINVSMAPEGLQYPTTALRNHGVADVLSVFSEYRSALELRVEQWRSGFQSIAADWSERAIGLHEEIAVMQSGTSLSGVFIGLAEDGAMRLSTASGEKLVHAGDVVIPSLVAMRKSA